MQKEMLHIGEIHDHPIPEERSFLSVNGCGAGRYNGSPYRVIREKGRKDFHILLSESGFITVYYEGRYERLLPGQFILYYPGQRQEYSFSSETPSVNSWVHFHGTSALSILSDCGLSGGIHTVQNKAKAEQKFEKLAQAHHPTSGATETQKSSILLSLLCTLSDKKSTAPRPEAVQNAVRFLHANYTAPIEIAELARMNNLSPSRFQHVFKQYVGTSPHHYLLSLKIEHAKELLTSDVQSVSAVASIVGFEDAYYFSRIFKKFTGITPGAYRKSQNAENTPV
ncbi:MAG: helix-turn-helix transcriptional regulator [Clostridia bacterium]|nr:helix-turn-helix transcriptional regulator [Clostridia bacterium]